MLHRCQFVRTVNQVAFYNDSKGTNVGATIAAINGLGEVITGKIILIAGGISKNADFKPLKQPISRYVSHVVLIGESAQALENILQQTSATVIAQDMQQAVELAYQAAHPNDVVLLSPACASFDMFKNFEGRGEQFSEQVLAL